MAEKFTLSLTAEDIDSRLKKIPSSSEDWTSTRIGIIDQSFNAESRKAQSGVAISEYVEDYVAEYVTDSVGNTVEDLNNSITVLAKSVNDQVGPINSELAELRESVDNLNFDILKDKPFYSEINYKNAQTIIPLQEVSFAPHELNPDVYIARIKASPESPLISVGGKVKLKINSISYLDTISYTIDQYEPVFSIGSAELIEEGFDAALADKSYFVCSQPEADGNGFEILIALYIRPEEFEEKQLISLVYTETELPVLSNNYDYEVEEFELDDGTLGAGFEAVILGLNPSQDKFNLSFNGKTYTNISFILSDDFIADSGLEPEIVEALLEEFSGVFFLGNPSLIAPDVLPPTSDDFFLVCLDDRLAFYTTARDKLSTLSFTKVLQQSEYVHKLDDRYLAYTESYAGDVIFNRDVLVDGGDISIRELKKDVEALEAKPDLLVAGPPNILSPVYRGLSANPSAIPTGSNAWIEGTSARGKYCVGSVNMGHDSVGYSYTSAKMQIVDSYLQILLDYSSVGSTVAAEVFNRLNGFNYAKVSSQSKTYLVRVYNYEIVDNTILKVSCSKEDVDFQEEQEIKELLFYPRVGDSSHSEGHSTLASGSYSHAEGAYTKASYSSHAEGYNTVASGDYAHTEGSNTEASGDYSHAEGYLTKASGYNSHTEGYSTKATNSNAHAEGNSTEAAGAQSHAEGAYTKATNQYSHAEGYSTEASGSTAHAEGYYTVASGDYSHAEGSGYLYSKTGGATGKYSHVEGLISSASGEAAHAEGHSTHATGKYSHAEGWATNAIGVSSHAEGYNTEASGDYSHAEGYNTVASGDYAHTEGSNTEASGGHSHTEGYHTVASNSNAHAEGNYTEATGASAHAEGNSTEAAGGSSHAEGAYTKAMGMCSHVEGYYTEATGDYSHVEGKYNIIDTDKQYAHILGNGTSDIPSNAHTVDWEGNAWFAGNISANSFISESSGESLGISTSNGVVLNDIETDLAYVLQIKNGQISTSLLPEEITIAKLPDKLTYIAGERVDLSGIEFLAHYPDGSTSSIEPNSVVCEPAVLTDEGQFDIQVKIRFYNVFEDYFSVTVEPFIPENVLIDFTYEIDTDGTYILTGWNETLNGVPSTELIIPDNTFIKL